jgi:hypothetical protein
MDIYRIYGHSCLSALRPGWEYRPALDEDQALGSRMVRVFCGALPWCGQELSHVYDRLPTFLDECNARGMDVYCSYITEAGTGYDLEAHVDTIEDIVRGRLNVLREVANEPYHGSQGGRLSPDRCLDLADRMDAPTGLGAPADDESTEYGSGAFQPWHRDRSRDQWNQVRRQREGEALSGTLHKPVFDQEGIGAGEVDEPGKREADPSIFFTQAILARLFELGGTIFHSQNGLDATTLQPNQRACAEAFRDGWFLWNDPRQVSYQNSNVNGGWENSPVQWHNVNTCVRAYSGTVDRDGFTVALGLTADPEIQWGAGWVCQGIMDARPGVTVYRVSR